MNKYTYLSRLFFLLVVAAVSGCGSAPSMSESKRLSEYAKKAEAIAFVYRKANLRNSSTGHPMTYNANGIMDFGPHLTKQASSVFAQYSVRVASARQIQGDDPLGPMAVDRNPDLILVVHISKGTLTSSRSAETASFIFDAQMINPATGLAVWQASIDTSTWNGKDFVSSNVSKTLYDETYANQLLKTLADRLKHDGII